MNPRLLLIFSLLFFLTGCYENVPGLKPSGLNSAFDLPPDSDFQTYISHYRQVLEQSRVDLDGPARKKIIEANLPFEMVPDGVQPSSRGILLIHGLFDSPYHMRALGEHFRKQGFLVRGILLPGHGTVPGDQREVAMQEWVKATEYGVNSLKKEVDRIYIGGFSTGGALAILYALEKPGTVAGLFLFSPCLKVNTGFDWLASPLSKMKTWLISRKGLDYARYESFAANSVAQVYLLTKRINDLTSKNAGQKLSIPVFGVISNDDRTVSSNHTIRFFKENVTHPASRLTLYSDGRTIDPPQDSRIPIIDASVPGQNILGSAHPAITIPPDDPHYGPDGDYRNCLHYFYSAKKSEECRTGKNNLLGEITAENLAKGTVQRLTWNPKYQEMLAGIDTFLASLPDN